MSLKGFHILFIVLAILVSFGFAGWVFFLASGMSALETVMGILSAALGVVLVPYGVWFVIKSRRIIT